MELLSSLLEFFYGLRAASKSATNTTAECLIIGGEKQCLPFCSILENDVCSLEVHECENYLRIDHCFAFILTFIQAVICETVNRMTGLKPFLAFPRADTPFFLCLHMCLRRLYLKRLQKIPCAVHTKVTAVDTNRIAFIPHNVEYFSSLMTSSGMYRSISSAH